MKFLLQVVVIFVANTYVGRCDDNVAMESDVSYQQTYPIISKIHVLDDRSYNGHSTTATTTLGKNIGGVTKESHTRSNLVYGDRQKTQHDNMEYVRDGSGIRYPQGVIVRHEETQEEGPLPDTYRHDASHTQQTVTHQVYSSPQVVSQQVVQQLPSQQVSVQQGPLHHVNAQQASLHRVSGQQIYQVPTHQLRVYGAQASHLQSAKGNEHEEGVSGFTSYVEHFSEKDNTEELQSAVSEGTINDIKRLVPKSGVTFKMYHPDKSSVIQKTVTQTSTHYHPQINQQQTIKVPQTSSLQFKIEVPETHTKQTGLDEAKLLFLKNQINQQHADHSKPSFQVVTQIQHPPSVKVYHPQIEGQSHQIQNNFNAQSTVAVEPQHQIRQENYKITTKNQHHDLNSITTHQKPQEAFHYTKYSSTQSEKPQEAFHYTKYSSTQSEKPQEAYQYTKFSSAQPEQPQEAFQYTKYSSTQPEKPQEAFQYTKFNSNQPEKPTPEEQLKQMVSTPPETYHFQESSYIDIEVPKNSQTFDHQKALEGSTSFDIKNAIGNTNPNQESSLYVHQPPEIVPFPHSSVLPTPEALTQIKTEGVEEHKHHFDALTANSEYSHLLSGKLTHLPQHWQEHTVNNFHHQLPVKLHLSKDVHHQIKPQEFQTQQHIPQEFIHQTFHTHQEIPFIKYPQNIHFQPGKIQNYHYQAQHIGPNHIKPPPSKNVEFTFQKPKFPSLNMPIVKTEIMPFTQEPGKKIIPILMKKRKNRSSKDVSVVLGRPIMGQRPVKPRNDKAIKINYPSGGVHSERKNEFSVSASYKVDRSLKNVNSS